MDINEESMIVWLLSVRETELPIKQNVLQSITNDVRTFNEPDDCVEYLLSLQYEKVFLVLGRGRSTTIYALLECSWIVCIYLLEYDEDLPGISNIRGSFLDCSTLVEQLKMDINNFQHSHTHLTFCSQSDESSSQIISEDEARFFWSQMLLDGLLNVKRPHHCKDVYDDLLEECRLYCRRNPIQMEQIVEFERTYTLNDAIRWYTRDTFVYRLLNKALRTQNILVIFKFRTIIQDIYWQLEHEYRSQIASAGTSLIFSTVKKILQRIFESFS